MAYAGLMPIPVNRSHMLNFEVPGIVVKPQNENYVSKLRNLITDKGAVFLQTNFVYIFNFKQWGCMPKIRFLAPLCIL